VGCRYLMLRRLMLNSARTACVGNVIRIRDRVLLDDCPVDIGVVNDGRVHVDDGRVVRERSASPFATRESHSQVAAAVVHASVIAHLRAPISGVEPVMPSVPAPVRRSPQGSRIGCRHPRARNPVVVPIARIPGPVARSPHQVSLGAYRNFIYREHRWLNANVDADAKTQLRLDRNC